MHTGYLTQKPDVDQAQRLYKEGEKERRRLYRDLFGHNGETKSGAVEEYQKMLEAHVFQNGGQLRDYQAEGVAWMFSNFLNEMPSILADEMGTFISFDSTNQASLLNSSLCSIYYRFILMTGLGKTIQTCAFLDLLATKLNRKGPFLIIVPLTTLGNWEKELNDWLDLNTVVYHGTAEDRDLIREFEFARSPHRPKNSRVNELYLRKCRSMMPRAGKVPGNPWMAEVVLTTPEALCTDDYTELTTVEWEVVVVDESQRLKNHKSKFAANLRDRKFQFGHKILLTGTPIQNNVQEFWALLNFIKPDSFGDCEAFLEKYGDMKDKEVLDDLHDEIRPFILRRLKEDVEHSVPPKEETLIEVELTLSQKQYYRALYEKNVKFLHRNKRKPIDGPSLSNLAMQLRKVCNHLFLLRGAEQEFHNEQLKHNKDITEGDLLVKASGKLVLLDKLLPRLKENGHRVLIFSQFKIMLDVLQDYLRTREMKCERIDGSITGKQRQQAIDRFQAPESEGRELPFVMLLSTRAGGLGINLTAADTCIIFDSDFNPQNDLQAQARCHRIGQTKNVKVYRLLSSKTYEMHLFNISSLKMGLDQAVLNGFEAGKSGQGTLTKEEVERLLREGAYSIFSEEKACAAEAESSAFAEQDIDTILERRSRKVVYENTGSQSKAAGGAFSKARFTTASKFPNGKTSEKVEDVDIEDPAFWEKIVGEGNENEDEGQEEILPEKRRRVVKNYAETNDDADQSDGNKGDDDDEFEEAEEESDSDDDVLDVDILEGSAPFKKSKYQTILPSSMVHHHQQEQEEYVNVPLPSQMASAAPYPSADAAAMQQRAALYRHHQQVQQGMAQLQQVEFARARAQQFSVVDSSQPLHQQPTHLMASPLQQGQTAELWGQQFTSLSQHPLLPPGGQQQFRG